MFCPNCGKKIPDSSAVCGYCGTRLGNQAVPPPQPPPYQPPPYQPPPAQSAPPTHVVVKAGGGGGFLSDVSGCLNLVVGGVLVALITLVVLLFFCIVKVPGVKSGYPQVVTTAWTRLYDWQNNQCRAQNPAPPTNNDGKENNGGQDGQDGQDPAQECPAGEKYCHGVCCPIPQCVDTCPCGYTFCEAQNTCLMIGAECNVPPPTPPCSDTLPEDQCEALGGNYVVVRSMQGVTTFCQCPGVDPFGN